MNTNIEVIKGLVLSDPFMIASSHWTSTEAAFRRLAKVAPAALTLKTTSILNGGDGKDKPGLSRTSEWLIDSVGNNFGKFHDGPRTLEFWDIATTFNMTTHARSILPKNCKIGLSVLQLEDYPMILNGLNIGNYDFVELNGKFAFRPISQFVESGLERIIADIELFLEEFSDLPILYKLPREAVVLIGTDQFKKLVSIISSANAGIIVANSMKCLVPPSLLRKNRNSQLDGVVVGEQLFLETYNMVNSVINDDYDGQLSPSVVASGGVCNIGEVLDLFSVGAKSIQLCTALDTFGPEIVMWFREQLDKICENLGQFPSLITDLKSDSSTHIRAAQMAKEYKFDHLRTVEKVLMDKGKMQNAFAYSLMKECVESPIPEPSDEKEDLPNDVEMAVIAGNVSSFLISIRCVMKFNLVSKEFASTTFWLEYLKRRGNSFDFAIVPRSSLKYLETNPEAVDDKNTPIELIVVAKSVYELVGMKGMKIDTLETVYRFDGTSSRHAFDCFLQEQSPIRTALISSKEKLLPLFKFWHDSSAILIKPPLSQIYGMLGKPNLLDNWESCWSTEEDLVLVTSKNLLKRDENGSIRKNMINVILTEKNDLASRPDVGAKELINMGFLNYCRNLLYKSS